MKLSIAMALGRVMCKMEAGDWSSCALGVAANAVGIPQGEMKCDRFGIEQPYMPDGRFRWNWIEQVWPWISGDYMFDIFHKFDHEVCKGKMTFEQLIDYVKSIEPDCECNRFNCSCEKVQTLDKVEEWAIQE